MEFFLIIILFFQLFKIIFSQIKIPFKNNIDFSTLTSENFINKLSNMNITSYLSLGTPFQTLPFNIKLSNYHLICLSNNSSLGKKFISFEENKSSSFQPFDKGKRYCDLKETLLCRRGKDIFKISENNIINNLSFYISYDLEKNQSGILGFKFAYKFPEYNFINQLKEKNLILSYLFYFKFKNLYEGEIIIGNYPHEIDKNKYDVINMKNSRIPQTFTNQDYSIQIESIKYGEKEIAKDKEFYFDFENYFFLCSLDFHKVIKEEFFNNLLEEKKCEEKKLRKGIQDVFYYFCDNNIDLSKFKEIKFKSINFDYEFILKPDELFIKSNNKMFFIIYFMDSFEKRWSFGYYFMKKYLIIFDQNRKLIIFYNKIKENNIQISIIISIIFGIIIIGLVIYIYNNLKKKRKIRANELEENFEYIQQN